jgi:hypothetical protein
MRKLLLAAVALLALGVPAFALADALGASDGTLVVRNADGKVAIRAVGGLIGRVDKGRIALIDPVDADGTGPIVNGCNSVLRFVDLESGGTMAICKGDKIRFRLVGGRFRVIVTGTGIDLAAVGHGAFTLNGEGGLDGRYSLNGEDFRSLPDDPQTFPLSAPPATP